MQCATCSPGGARRRSRLTATNHHNYWSVQRPSLKQADWIIQRAACTECIAVYSRVCSTKNLIIYESMKFDRDVFIAERCEGKLQWEPCKEWRLKFLQQRWHISYAVTEAVSFVEFSCRLLQQPHAWTRAVAVSKLCLYEATLYNDLPRRQVEIWKMKVNNVRQPNRLKDSLNQRDASYLRVKGLQINRLRSKLRELS